MKFLFGILSIDVYPVDAGMETMHGLLCTKLACDVIECARTFIFDSVVKCLSFVEQLCDVCVEHWIFTRWCLCGMLFAPANAW